MGYSVLKKVFVARNKIDKSNLKSQCTIFYVNQPNI